MAIGQGSQTVRFCVLVCGAALAACGGGASSTVGSAADTVAATPAPTSVAAGTTTTGNTGITGNTGSNVTAAEAQAMLDDHNAYRTAVGVPTLAWSAAAASFEQGWLNQLAASSCTLQHNGQGTYGENLFAGTVGYYTVRSAVASWGTEKAAYAGEAITNTNYQRFGHYTQMVWRATTQVGCAKATCGNTLLVGCAYAPAGNVVGERAY